MIDKEFISILACPETGQPLFEADAETCAKINALIKKGKVRNGSGTLVTKTADGFLSTKDGARFYPVSGGTVSLVAGGQVAAKSVGL